MNDNILKLMGKLALSKALIESANASLNDLLDNYELKRALLDEEQLQAINRVLSNIDYSKGQIDDAIFDLATEIFNSVLNEGGNDDTQKHQN